jgi:hypothetical protein
VTLYRQDARIILGMSARGDKDHNIAAWFGENQGRIAEAKAGDYGTLECAPANELPPAGPPGVKGRRLRGAIDKALEELGNGNTDGVAAVLKDAIARYDANES